MSRFLYRSRLTIIQWEGGRLLFSLIVGFDFVAIRRARRGVSADTAMRLARYFGGDARSWLTLQAAYDLRVAEIASAKRIEREIAPATA